MRKNKQNKSLYSIIMITMLSLFVFACGGSGGGSDGGGGELGTSGNPFLVDSAETLQKILSEEDGLSLSAHYKQEVDIVLTDANWIPIGSSSKPFTGTYNGNNKKISKLKIDAPSSNNLGLFGYIGAGGTVKNLGLEEVEINGGNNVGSVAGTSSGTVQNCYVAGDVKGRRQVGGVVGANDDGTVQNCYAIVDVGIYFNPGGGVVGFNSGTIKNCYATGNIYGSSIEFQDYPGYGDFLGGIVGSNDGTVENCYATGSVIGTYNIGGVVGSNGGTVKNCIALNSAVTIRTSYTYVGRVAGLLDSETSNNNYARYDMGGSVISFTVTTHNGKDGADLLPADYYDPSWWTGTAKWSFGESDVWNTPSGTTLPTLKNMLTGTQTPTVP